MSLPTQDECITYLEKIRWGDKPICPYCGSSRASKYKEKHRYHCHDCFTSYSVTVGTLFHKTHVDLQKWFQAINLISNNQSNISIRQLARTLGVNKNTASDMRNKIFKAIQEDQDLTQKLIKSNIFNQLL
jgi:transposase-like protein